MALTQLDGNTTILNGLCVVKDDEKDVIAYHPGKPPTLPPFADPCLSLLTAPQKEWWKAHPSWPKELELDWTTQAEDRGWGDFEEPLIT